jgi:quinol monooxygenase YgiN
MRRERTIIGVGGCVGLEPEKPVAPLQTFEGSTMPEPVVYIDRSRIRPGKSAQLRRAIDDLVDFIGREERQLLHYGFYLDEAASRMTVVAVHPDTASVERHMDVGGEAFRGFADLLEMEAIEVYGEATPRMLEQLAAKADALGDVGSVTVVPLEAGFHRLQVHPG